MANENETVEQVCEFFHYRLNAKGCFGSPFVSYAYEHGDNDKLVVYIRKTFDEFKERVMAALKRAVKSLEWKVDNYAQVVAAKDKEIAKRDALIKELADALDGRLCEYACEIHGECLAGDDMNECLSVKHRALVAKAREVLK